MDASRALASSLRDSFQAALTHTPVYPRPHRFPHDNNLLSKICVNDTHRLNCLLFSLTDDVGQRFRCKYLTSAPTFCTHKTPLNLLRLSS